MQAMRACRQQLAPCAAAAAAPQLLWRRAAAPGRRCSKDLWQQQHPQLSSSSERGHVRCSSAASPTPLPQPQQPPPPQLAWLTDVSMLLPCSSNSNNSDINNNNGSSSSSTWQAPQYEQLPPGQLNTLQLDAIFVLAGGLLPDGGLPEWVHRRLDLARELHLQQHRRPPIVCLGELAYCCSSAGRPMHRT